MLLSYLLREVIIYSIVIVGLLHVNTVKQYKLCLFIQFIQSWQQKQFDYLVFLDRKNKKKISSLKFHKYQQKILANSYYF